MKLFMLCAIALTLAACAGAPLNETERAVRIYTKSDPPANCKELGKANSAAIMATEEQREDGLKRAASQLGGNAVRLDNNNSGMLMGTAYKCN